ncbi:hypothetical protein HanRHA438_Chr17g0791021 [Helianthus annuus]|nr:hypothetical protein HanRHA438_Chr17g0791021 [Helianthus annuus]
MLALKLVDQLVRDWPCKGHFPFIGFVEHITISLAHYHVFFLS